MVKNFKIKILQLLASEGPRTFGQLQKDLETRSPTGVNYALAKLKKDDFIMWKKEQRCYHITERGRLYLQNAQLTRQISSNVQPGFMEKQQTFPNPETKSIPSFEPLLQIEPILEEQNRFPFDLSLIGDAQVDFQRLLKKIDLMLTYVPQQLTREFAEEIAWQRGLKRPRFDNPKKFLSETLKWIKEAYNYEITLMLHFNPRQTVNSVKWTKAIKKANETEEKVARGIEILNQDLQEVYRNKEEALKTFVNEYLKAALGEMTFFLESAYNSPLNSDSNIATSEEALLDKITERILHDPYVEGRATKEKIRTILDAMVKGGSIKVTSMTIYGIEKREKIP